MIIMNSREDRSTDWKDNLCVEDEQMLNMLVESTKRHKCAYKSAENAQIAQMWCALIEQLKMVNRVEARVAYIERVLGGLFKGHEEERGKALQGLYKF